VYKNIIWDVDGTLFNAYPAIAAAFKAALAEKGVETDSEWIMKLAMQSMGHCVATLANEYHISEAAIEEAFWPRYRSVGYPAQPPFPHVREVCEQICLGGGSNVIVTHRETDGTIGLLRAHQLIDLFKGWITRDDDYPKKPDPTAFRAALTRFGLDPYLTMAVGDRDIDTIAAQGAGLFTCQYTTDCQEAKPDLQMHDFAQLLEYLSGK
jgi:phosphoglycolate phosphatase-like HAD superfamily hydrolase